ncbi:MAG: class I SAM-dependent methyltransferase, partial [Bacteroidota bacterium]|nr:class I SAM-dependent methyltransferase [Bacteroidota bacterium]
LMPSATFYGYEIGGKKVVETFEGGRVTIIKGSFSDAINELPVCNMITMNHVIEHLPDPFQTIRQLTDKLRPGGYIEGQTPNSDSSERMIFKEGWSGFHSPRHTVVFSKKGLEIFLERVNLSHVRVTPAFNPAGIAVSLATLPHGKKSGTIKRQGIKWLAMLGFSTAFAPLDRLSGKPGIINFIARK